LVGLLLWLTGVSGLAAETSPDPDDPPTWNVTEPDFSVAPAPIGISTEEGTWMSLSVSPDGRTLAFDFLGDIYLLPIEGGRARNISPGFHWDMQPAFSPDGQRIAFTSDRDGGDNIWVMNVDGSEPRQISREKFRLTNNPAWSPDGRYVAARKHFTTQRSLGAGEIWLYHLDGGSGVPLVERPGPRFQKELGEPAFTPDGQHLYYAQNVTPGDAFVYAQDSNREIFRIRRVTLETGEVLDIAGGPGGAVRPTPSPDGKLLAFVRRVRAESRLFVKDLATGRERMLVDRLDQDMQESWAVHGVYPNMAFTPDSASVVFWTGGKLHRVDVNDGTVWEIPFLIEDERTIYEAPRFPVEVSPETFQIRMVRWAQAVPDSDDIVFEALGRLFTQPAGGEAARLTRDDSAVFELFPVTSRDWPLGLLRRLERRGPGPDHAGVDPRRSPLDGARRTRPLPGTGVEPGRPDPGVPPGGWRQPAR
jgi:hypothetical protein